MPNSTAVFVIPAFNEEQVINETIAPIIDAGFMVICVDDASVDNTNKEALKAGAFVIRHLINAGQGAALQTGFDFILQSGSLFEDISYVVTFDADGQHSLKDVESFFEAFDVSPELDVVLGSRFLSLKFKGSGLKKLALKTIAFMSQYTLGLKLTDRHNGFRVIRKEKLELFQILSPGYDHADEFLHIISKNGLRFIEVPTDICYTDYSVAKGQPLINGFKILFDRLINGWR